VEESMSRLASAAALLWCGAALAQDRLDEATLFGPPSADAGTASSAALGTSGADGGVLANAVEVASQTPGPAASEGARDARELSAPNTSRNAFATGESVENPLQIGGLFYLRGYASARENTSFNHTSYSVPLQVNGFMDARPNERIRAYVLGRL